jgi:hypothetical protein
MAIKNSSVTATTAANIYVSSGNTVITTIHLCNYSGSVVTANLYLAPSGNVAGVNNIIYANCLGLGHQEWLLSVLCTRQTQPHCA